MEKDKTQARKSHNRVHKEYRDYETLFNTEIDTEARERRREKRQKRNRHQDNAVLGFIIRISKIRFSGKPKTRQQNIERPIKQERLMEVAAKKELPVFDVQKEIAAPISRLAEEPKPTTREPEPVLVMKEEVTKPIEIAKEEVKPVREKKERVRKEPKPVKERVQKERAPGSIGAAISRFYAQLTDKEEIAKLRQDPQDLIDMFAEIKETLDATPADAIDIQSPNYIESEDKTSDDDQNKPESAEQIVFDVLQEEVRPEDAHGHIEESEENRKGTEEPHDDHISTAVDILFESGDNAQAQIEQLDDALIPEVVEAMKEIDYDHVMGVLQPKLASSVDKVDQFLDRMPRRVKRRMIVRLRKRNILPHHDFIVKPIKGFAKAKNGALSILGFIGQRAVTPIKLKLNNFGLFLARKNHERQEKSQIKRDEKQAKRNEHKQAVLSGEIQPLFYDKIEDFFQKFNQKIRDIIGREKSILIASSASFVIVMSIVGYGLYLESITAYEVLFSNSSIGLVKEKDDIFDILPEVEKKLKSEYGNHIYISKDDDFTFKQVRQRGLDVMSETQIMGKFDDISKINVSAYALQLDGETIAILPEKSEIENLLASIQDGYVADNEEQEYDSISFGENVQIVPVETKLIQMGDPEEVKKYLLKGTTEEKIHAVQPGETLSGIAKFYGIKTSEIIAANPDVDPTKLQINQEISLIAPKPFITVQTKETKTYVAEIPFDITYEESANLFKGENNVKSAGKSGERRVTAEITKQNGIEIARVELESEVLKEPVNQVVIQGSKPLPLLLGTGTFSKPVRGTLSSKYGQRWSRLHAGIDISAPKGTPIKAADGGTVIYAGYDGNYGNTVRINHGGNRVTVYAHCTKLLVKNGQKVAKGQQIGTVGTTGRTTGPHLHFEVRINGKIQNPLNYVSY